MRWPPAILIALLVTTLGLSACEATPTPTPTPTATARPSPPAATQTQEAVGARYRVSVEQMRVEMEATLARWAQKNLDTLSKDQAWLEKAKPEFDMWRVQYVRFNTLQAPIEFKEYHAVYQAGLKELNDGATLLEQGITASSESKIRDGTNKLATGFRFLISASELYTPLQK